MTTTSQQTLDAARSTVATYSPDTPIPGYQIINYYDDTVAPYDVLTPHLARYARFLSRKERGKRGR